MRAHTIAFLVALLPTVASAQPWSYPETAPLPLGQEVPPRPPPARFPLGITVMPMTPELRAYFGAPANTGTLIAQVIPDSPAARLGLRVGDVITRIGSDQVTTSAEISQAIERIDPMRPVSIQLIREGQRVIVQVQNRSALEGL